MCRSALGSYGAGMDIVRKLFVVSALTCAAAWLVKQVAIALTGGADSDAAVVGVLWALGALGLVLAAAFGAVLLASRAPVWVRVAVAVVAAPLSFVAMSVLDTAIKSVYTADGWFGDEVALVVLALVLGGLGLRVALGGPSARSVRVHRSDVASTG